VLGADGWGLMRIALAQLSFQLLNALLHGLEFFHDRWGDRLLRGCLCLEPKRESSQ